MVAEDFLIEGLRAFGRAENQCTCYRNHMTFKQAFKKAIKANGIRQYEAKGAKTRIDQRLNMMTWKVRFKTICGLVRDVGMYIAIVDKNGYLYPFLYGDDWKKVRRYDASTEELFSRIAEGTDSLHEGEGVDESE